MAQVFTTQFWGEPMLPIECKGNAHEALSLLLAQEGVPPKMIINGTKEMKLGEFA